MSNPYPPPPEQPQWNPATPAPPQPGQPPYGGYGVPVYGQPAPEHPQATAILVLGILSLVMCGLFTGIPAIIMGSKALHEIDASQGRIGGRGTVKAGWILGIIGTALVVVAIGFIVLLAVIGATASDTGTTFNG